MGKLGRLIVGETGTMLEVDAAFCATLKSTRELLLGRNALDVTALADRERCMTLLAGVMADRRTVSTVKRLLCADGSHVWVNNTLRYVTLADGAPACEVSSEKAVPPSDWVDPSVLLRLAKLILLSRRARERAFNAHFFGDPAWGILIHAYVSEAEGRTLSTADLHASIGISLANASRWIRALDAERLLEFEARGSSKALVTSPIRLSAEGHRRLEEYFCTLHHDAARMRDTLDIDV